ncbi:hypothetical protein P7C71_g3735, partial [Lecanoromycetidae sp. Uapishka_2]
MASNITPQIFKVTGGAFVYSRFDNTLDNGDYTWYAVIVSIDKETEMAQMRFTNNAKGCKDAMVTYKYCEEFKELEAKPLKVYEDVLCAVSVPAHKTPTKEGAGPGEFFLRDFNILEETLGSSGEE